MIFIMPQERMMASLFLHRNSNNVICDLVMPAYAPTILQYYYAQA